MRLWSVWHVHGNNCITKRILNRNLPSLVLACIKSAELLEFGIDLWWHLQAKLFKGRPVSRLQALDLELEVIFRRLFRG
jgi:hypothetical protein